ncbi:MAG: hypothetical protein KDC98_06230, partial [Planctomycetes bacterium]|nr:hypothetical protein [Planctomycetota bacterium]
ACYPALRRLPGRDWLPLIESDVRQPVSAQEGLYRLSRHDAPRRAKVADGGRPIAIPHPHHQQRRPRLSAIARRAASGIPAGSGNHP